MWTSPPWWRLPDPQGVPRWPSAHCLCRHSFISLSSRPGHTGVSLSEPLVPDVSGTRAASPAPVWAHSNCYRSAAATVTEGLVPRVLLHRLPALSQPPQPCPGAVGPPLRCLQEEHGRQLRGTHVVHQVRKTRLPSQR